MGLRTIGLIQIPRGSCSWFHVMSMTMGMLLFCAAGTMCLHGGGQSLGPVENPHFNPSKCSFCHDSMSGNSQELRSGKDVIDLCQRCHDGKKAKSELHPVGMNPSAEIAVNIPRQFPLHDGLLSCLSCHDISNQCKGEPQNVQRTHNFLRGDSRLAAFCSHCHVEEEDLPFNVHDQLDDSGRPKSEACLWCHLELPEVTSFMKDSEDFGLRDEAHVICRNCHPVNESHPVGGRHILVAPSRRTVSQMAQYVGISLKKYLKAQVFPLDEKGRITCFSCHNPHEEGLFTSENPRSLGAEPMHAEYKRLRRINPQERPCKVCHSY